MQPLSRVKSLDGPVLGCVTQFLQSAVHLYEQFLQVHRIGFVTLGPLRHA